MLEHLEISNFALIENLSVDFHSGFNVITGETGAGKSIILGALGLLMGEKADASAIRAGANEITVNTVISVPENHEILPWLNERGVFPENNEIILKRIVRLNGRSVIYVQGQLFTRQDLAFLADSLIDMHGQSEHQSLLLLDKQRKIVDSYTQDNAVLNVVSETCKKIINLKKQMETLQNQIEESRRQKDYLTFALDEIEKAKIQPDEDIDLKAKIQVLGQYETIRENLNACTEKLKNARSVCYDACTNLAKSAKCDNSLTDYTTRLESLQIELEDIYQSLQNYSDGTDYSEDTVNALQNRLAVLQKLKRKYGQSLEEVLTFAADARQKLNISENSENLLKNCETALQDATEKYRVSAKRLTQIRQNSARALQGKIQTVLRTLGMPNAEFSIEIQTDEEKISSNGFDNVVFKISANPGEPQKNLKDIASGGELSRVMLALKTVLARADSIETQIFDEIDSGIGGSVALNLASCIGELSKEKQVIAITHLASVAGKADFQFVVSKTVQNGRTFSHLRQIEGEERVREIARMLSGDESEISINHARTMLAENQCCE